MHFIRQRKIFVNLIVLSVVWATTTLNYFMVQYILNQFKDEYKASLMSATSDIIGFILGGLIFYKTGPKYLFIASNALACVGGIVLLVYGLHHEGGWTLPALVFVSKLGVAVSLNTVWVAHNSIFPVLFSATALGMVNFFARLAGAFSPLFDLMEEPYPMLIFSISSGIASLLSICL